MVSDRSRIEGNDVASAGRSLHVVATAGWAVWAAAGPVPVDTASWTPGLWLAQARGLRWHPTISDGGAAIDAAARAVDPPGRRGRDGWHGPHACARVQGRLARWATQVEAQTVRVRRQAARLAAGRRPRGRDPRTDLAAHLAVCDRARAVAASLRSWTGLLRDPRTWSR